MKFLKLILAELKKIFLKPTMLILTGLLIAVLCLNAFIYNPKNLPDNIIRISGTSISEIRNKFYSTSGTYTKFAYDSMLSDKNTGAIAYINLTNNDNDKDKQQLILHLDQLILLESDFIQKVNSNQPIEQIYQSALKVKNDTILFSNNLNSILVSKTPTCIIKNSDYETITSLISSYKKQINVVNPATTLSEYNYIISKIQITNCLLEIKSDIQRYLIPTKISEKVSFELNKVYEEAIQKLSIQNEIIENYEDSTLSLQIEKFNKEITKYIEISSQASEIIELTFLKNLHSNLDSYYNYNSYNKYVSSYNLIKNKFLFNNNLYSFDISETFNNNNTISNKTTAYDFVFNSMQILSLIIIVFSIIIATSIISGEYSSGSIKLLLIRPYSRNKILTAKLISTIIISALFIFISSLFCFIIGGIMYGFESINNILTIFNSNYAIVIHPLVLLLIYIITLIIENSIYILITIFVSILIKNAIIPTVICLSLYFAGLICNMFISWNKFSLLLPYPNLKLFNYFMPVNISNQLGNIFTGNYNYINIIISIIYVIILTTTLTIFSYKFFNKQDI